MKIQGTNLLMGRETSGSFAAFGYSRSCEISEQRDTIETASPTSAQWKDYKSARCSWTMTCECLLSDNETVLETAFRQGIPILVTCRPRGESGYRYRGYAIITSLRASGRIHEMATYSIGLQGTGELEYMVNR